jgi:hypothetical protein
VYWHSPQENEIRLAQITPAGDQIAASNSQRNTLAYVLSGKKFSKATTKTFVFKPKFHKKYVRKKLDLSSLL